jgi:hypothetical protein
MSMTQPQQPPQQQQPHDSSKNSPGRSGRRSTRGSSAATTSTTTSAADQPSRNSRSSRSLSNSKRSSRKSSSIDSGSHHSNGGSSNSSSKRNGVKKGSTTSSTDHDDHNNKRKGRRPVAVGGSNGQSVGILRTREEKQHQQQYHHERMNQNLQSHRNDDISDDDHDDHDDDDDHDDHQSQEEYDEEEIVESSEDDFDKDDDDDDDCNSSDDGHGSVYTTITVETTRTKENENRKPTIPAIFGGGAGTGKTRNTQVSVGEVDPVGDLQLAMNDITKLSIYMKNVSASQAVSANFLSLMRGDNRSWEAIAVDILRQKARWESIVIEECSSARPDENSNGGTPISTLSTAASASASDSVAAVAVANTTDYLDLILTHILCVDNCAYLHLSNFVWTDRTAWSMMALQFCKSIQKLQLDLIYLKSSIPMLSRGLKDNKSLKVLITSRCGLQDDELGVLLSHLPEPLEELRIFGNRCRSKGLASLTAAIQERTTCLKHLDLSYQHVGPDEEFDISWFAEALGRKNKTLKVLDLDNVSLDDGHLAHLVAALCRNKTLEELMLNHNKISGAGVAMLATRFGEMKGLKKISMYSNLFDAPGNTNDATNTSSTGGAASAGGRGSGETSGGGTGTGIDHSKNETAADSHHNTSGVNSTDGRDNNTHSNGLTSANDGGLSNDGSSNYSTTMNGNTDAADETDGRKTTQHNYPIDDITGTPQRSNRMAAGGKENAFAQY